MKSSPLPFWTCILIAALLTTLAVAQQRRPQGGRGGAGAGGLQTFRFPTSMPTAVQQWEYGRLDFDLGAQESAKNLSWRGPAGEHAEGATAAELCEKMGGVPSAPQAGDDLPLWNLLGEKGWEFATRETHKPAEGPAGVPSVTVRFKRLKH